MNVLPLVSWLQSYVMQAIEKLALAEGTKVAMTWVQSAYEQGIYGLVVNLGSIAARLLLQPFEEAAFLAFSRPQDPDQQSSAKRLELLNPLVKLAFLFGRALYWHPKLLWLSGHAATPYIVLTARCLCVSSNP